MSGGEPGQIPDTITVDVAPSEMKSTISGTGNRVLDAPEMHDKVVAIVELECMGTGFKALDKGTQMRVEWKMLDLFVLPVSEGRDRLRKARSEHRVGLASSSGEVPLPGWGDVGYTDENGVVLTVAEVADRQGRGVPVVEVAAVVVVYSDGSRLLWPDEFEGGVARPGVFDEVGFGVSVVELLDPVTGEPVDSASPADDGDVVGDSAVDDGVVEVEGWDDPVGVDPWEVDPLVSAFLAGTATQIRSQVKSQISLQFLLAVLAAECGCERPRVQVVQVVEARIAELRK